MSSTDRHEPASDLRAALGAMWASVAPSWAAHADRIDARDEAETAVMLAAAAVGPGDRVLELACGPGGLGLAAAALVGPDGEVVLSDVAAEMVAVAGERATARGLTNVTAHQYDLAAVGEPDGSFDAVLCRDGLMLVPDPVQGAREVARVLRPDGHAVVAVLGPRNENPWLGLLFDAVTARTGMSVPPDGMPGPFSLDDPARLAAVLTDGGLVDVQVREISMPFVVDSADDWWSVVPALAGPMAAVLADLPDDVRAAIRADAAAALEPFATAGGGYEMPGVNLVASGTAPSS